MLSLLSSSYILLRLTQITNAYIMLNTLCEKLDYKIRRMCYRNVIIGLSFKTVPKMGFRVFGKKLLSFSGGATGARIGRSMSLFEAFLFLEKRFCQNRDMQPPVWPKNGPKWPKTA